MSARLGWLFVFVALYATYCIFWGADSARGRRGALDYFLAGRSLPFWVFAASATTISFTGWMVIGLPASIFRDGFQASALALGAIVIPLAGALVISRQWILSRRFGFVTPVEMYADYFGGPLIRPILLLIALLFAIPFLGLQLAATGYLIEVLSAGAIPWALAMWALGALVFAYVALGGLRAASFVGVLQALMLAATVVAGGIVAWVELGGFGAFVGLLAKLGASKAGDWGAAQNGYNAYFATPGVVQFVAGFGRGDPVGGVWTTSMVFSTVLSLMGFQLAPAFAVLAFSTRDARGFAPQQVWLAGATVGFGLVFFSVIAGVGALLLGASPSPEAAALTVGHDLPALQTGREVGLLAYYLSSLAGRAPWFLGLLAVAATAATQATVALYASASGTMFARDFYVRYLRPDASDSDQKLFGRIGVGFTILFALIGATYAPRAQALFGALALPFALQLLPAALALTWLRWLTPQAVLSGLVVGLTLVFFTEQLGLTLASFFTVDIPWGRWPWTIHSAVWGLFFNVAVCLLFSLLTEKRSRRERRMQYHDYLAEAAPQAPNVRVWRPIAWIAALAWIFFAIGPGQMFGVDLFGAPNAGPDAWLFGIPSIWAWQIMGWAFGVLLLWLLAYRLSMSQPPPRPIEPEAEAIRRLQ
jgi:solute:Na+ symporter, SSS family